MDFCDVEVEVEAIIKSKNYFVFGCGDQEVLLKHKRYLDIIV